MARGSEADDGVREVPATETVPVGADLVSSIRSRFLEIQERIAEISSARPVEVVCVTKGFPVHVTVAAYEAGVRIIGENYAQELADKFSVTEHLDDLRRHFIGHIQTNKLGLILAAADVIETVSRISEMDRIARSERPPELLIQVKFDDDPKRSGALPTEVGDLVTYGSGLGLKISGLMTIAPNTDPAGRSEVFRMLRGLCDANDLEKCSMGMSDDFELAVAEGATEVRIGSAILGTRPNLGSGDSR